MGIFSGEVYSHGCNSSSQSMWDEVWSHKLNGLGEIGTVVMKEGKSCS